MREFRGSTPSGAFDTRPFNGRLAAGASVRLQLFGSIDLRAFGPGATYPDRPLPFHARLTAAGGAQVEFAGGPCVVGSAG